MHDFITVFGNVAANGQTLLWSSAAIGRFAVDDPEILKAAGVTDKNATPLDQTKIGQLWDQLKLTTASPWSSSTPHGYRWDSSSQNWNSISKEFASTAEGEVHVFVPKTLGAQSIFWNVELPELRNPNHIDNTPKANPVTRITVHHLNEDAHDKVDKLVKDETDAIDALGKQRERNEISEVEFQAATEKIKKECAFQKQLIMRNSQTWVNRDISTATIQVPKMSASQKKSLDLGEPSHAEIINYILETQEDKAGTVTYENLHKMGQHWKGQIRGLRERRVAELLQEANLQKKILEKYNGLAGGIMYPVIWTAN